MSPVRLAWPGRAEAEAAAELRLDHVKPRAEARPAEASTAGGATRERHRLICADNLTALGRLLSDPAESFHFIYIDPPYNTGQQLSFRDKHREPAHTSGRQGATSNPPITGSPAWLSFMLPRLRLARELLTADGLLCVSIDDHEQASLTMLLREIFGADNHIMTIKWRRKRKPSFLGRHASPVFEYVLVFARDGRQLPRLLGPRTSESSRPVLNQGNGIARRLLRAGTPAFVPNGTRPPGVHRNRSLSYELHDPLIIEEGKVAQDCAVSGPFRVSQDILDASVFITRNWGLRRKISEDEQKHRHASDDASDWPTNEDADSEILACYGERVFSFAKPVGMLRRLLAMYPAKHVKSGPGDIEATPPAPLRCLDFFAGTGTFGSAVLAQSRDDGIPRIVTLIQSEEVLATASKSLQDPRSPGTGRRWMSIFDLMRHRMGSDSEASFAEYDWRDHPDTAASAAGTILPSPQPG